ncbi:cytochrome c3 family protein [Aestuariirhabdus litorea]|uniref:Doubled CXXCH motif domain-containing protein n=1 Tax=Aestuariirhabdus litorea TaxID=2528527 RepID=A0A3P3VR42_9GAMM|nr:cytochrome c3 family protein [Aestuariirhabdus litorea]RRJ85262.1 hypothetical protein D0544_09425 [Aestuariirhabdus litorea]RWW98484.1 hypothetical protein DZC74_09410 [Endozoicomonadaceae bacterium GTF-13]
MFKSMTKNIGLAALGGALLVASAATFAGISGTKHNLGSGGVVGNNLFDGTAEICVFCHTPHGSDTSAPVPLWNRNINSSPTYTTYATLQTSSLQGKEAAIGSVSLACLSCHDGTQAMNSVINAPGSGGYNATGSPMAGTWDGTTVGSANGLLLDGITKIGTDLRDDHPISIQYAGGGFLTTSCTGGDGALCSNTMLSTSGFNLPRMAIANSNPVWWVDNAQGAGTDNARNKEDIQLYTRTDLSGDSNAQPFVECASCHDPHTSNTTFLRIENTGSNVCLSCHDK